MTAAEILGEIRRHRAVMEAAGTVTPSSLADRRTMSIKHAADEALWELLEHAYVDELDELTKRLRGSGLVETRLAGAMYGYGDEARLPGVEFRPARTFSDGAHDDGAATADEAIAKRYEHGPGGAMTVDDEPPPQWLGVGRESTPGPATAPDKTIPVSYSSELDETEQGNLDARVLDAVRAYGEQGASFDDLAGDRPRGSITAEQSEFRSADGAAHELGHSLDRLADAGHLETFKRDRFPEGHVLNGETAWRVERPYVAIDPPAPGFEPPRPDGCTCRRHDRYYLDCPVHGPELEAADRDPDRETGNNADGAPPTPEAPAQDAPPAPDPTPPRSTGPAPADEAPPVAEDAQPQDSTPPADPLPDEDRRPGWAGRERAAANRAAVLDAVEHLVPGAWVAVGAFAEVAKVSMTIASRELRALVDAGESNGKGGPHVRYRRHGDRRRGQA